MSTNNLKKAIEILQENCFAEPTQTALIHLLDHKDQVRIIENISRTKSEVFVAEKRKNERLSEEIECVTNISNQQVLVIQGLRREKEIMEEKMNLQKNISTTRAELIQGLKVENRELKEKTEKINQEIHKFKRSLEDTSTPERKRHRSE